MLSLPEGNEMFHFPSFPPHALCVQAWVTGHDSCRVSPFGNPRITARLTAPRGLSQPPTSFIGSWCQGIHRVPLLTWPQRCSRPLCSSQNTGGTGSNPPRAPTCHQVEVVRCEPVPVRDEAPPHHPRARGRGSSTGANGCRCRHPVPQDPTARQANSLSIIPSLPTHTR